jgi:hypothetical protein
VVLTYLAMSEEKIKYWAVGLVSNVRSIRLVAAAVLIASLVVAGCAPRSETPVTMVNGPSMRSSVVAMSMEPSIEVGDVTAVYVTVSNQSSNADPLGLTLLELHWPQAVDMSGKRLDRLDTDQAIEKAGGGDKLLAALGDREEEVERPLDQKIARDALMAPVIPIWIPGLLVVGPVALIYSSLQEPGYHQHSKVQAKEFQLSPTMLDPFGSHLLTYPGPPLDGLPPEWSEKGYVFFPRGSYAALQLTVREHQEYDKNLLNPLQTVTCQWRSN